MKQASSMYTLYTILISFLLATAYLLKSILVPLALAGMISTLLWPMARWFEQRGFSRAISSIFSMTAAALGSVVFILLIARQCNLALHDLVASGNQLPEISGQINSWLKKNGIPFRAENIFTAINDKTVDSIGNFAISSASMLINYLLMLAYISLLLYYRDHFLNQTIKFQENRPGPSVKSIVYRCAENAQLYLSGLLKMIACLWFMYGLGFYVIGIKHFIFFALLCGTLEIVPYIGNITGTLLTLISAYSEGATEAQVIGIICVYGLIQFIQGWFIEPFLVGGHVKLNPFFSLLALVFGQWIWGIAGVALAIPIGAVLKIVLDQHPATEAIGGMMGERKRTFIQQT